MRKWTKWWKNKNKNNNNNSSNSLVFGLWPQTKRVGLSQDSNSTFPDRMLSLYHLRRHQHCRWIVNMSWFFFKMNENVFSCFQNKTCFFRPKNVRNAKKSAGPKICWSGRWHRDWSGKSDFSASSWSSSSARPVIFAKKVSTSKTNSCDEISEKFGRRRERMMAKDKWKKMKTGLNQNLLKWA